MLFAGDIGGTKTVLALFSPERGPRQPVAEARFPSGDYPSLQAIVAEFLTGKDAPIERAVFGVAGPVVAGRAEVTNLPWVIEEHALSQALNLDPAAVRLLNDLEAIANFVPFAEAADLETLNAGQPAEHGPLAVIAPGTGLGEAFLIWNGRRYLACASEGGHTDFGPTTPTELDLLRYLQPRLGHVSYERVCSGVGIPNLYAYIKDSGRYVQPAWLREALEGVEDPTPIIVQAALNHKAEICTATLDLFVSILGSEAGNLALKLLATGGVYLGGGIPPRIVPQLRKPIFLNAFTNKGRFADLLSAIPVHVIRNPGAALSGAACYGLTLETPQ